MLSRREKLVVAFAVAVAAAGILLGPGGTDAHGNARARPADGFGKVVFHTYPRSQMLLRGTLLDAYGNPSGGTGVQVTVQPFTGGPAAVYGGFTDGAGRYSVRIPRGPSRLITLSAGGTTREIRELVAPYVWVTVRPLGNGKILFTGGVKMDHSTPPPTIVLRDRYKNQPWQTFAAAVPDANSHLYRKVYRHAPRSVIGVTLAFRATSLPTTAWRAGAGDAKEATVR